MLQRHAGKKQNNILIFPARPPTECCENEKRTALSLCSTIGVVDVHEYVSRVDQSLYRSPQSTWQVGTGRAKNLMWAYRNHYNKIQNNTLWDNYYIRNNTNIN